MTNPYTPFTEVLHAAQEAIAYAERAEAHLADAAASGQGDALIGVGFALLAINKQLAAVGGEAADIADCLTSRRRSRIRALSRTIRRVFGRLRADLRGLPRRVWTALRRHYLGHDTGPSVRWQCLLCDTWNAPGEPACEGCDTSWEAATTVLTVVDERWELRA